MWLFALYLIVPLTHSSYKVTAAISEISLYQWSKSSPQLFLAFGPEPRSINLIPPPLRGHPSKLSVCKNSTPLGLPWWSSGKTPFLMQEAQVQSLVSELRSHMLSSQKTTKKLNIPSSHLVFTMRCCYGCHQGMMSENPRSFLPSHFLPPFFFFFAVVNFIYLLFFLIFLFFFNFFYLWWILSYIEMKQPRVYMCSPSQSPLPPPSPPIPSRFSQCTRFMSWHPWGV